jgi:hypothetical protein
MSDQCDRCGAKISEAGMLIDSPVDPTASYCLDCYAYLFPPGWTDEQTQELSDAFDENLED